MGNLLKVLTCTDLEQGPNFFLDFESENALYFIFIYCLKYCIGFTLNLCLMHAYVIFN